MISSKIFKITTHSKQKRMVVRYLQSLGVHVQPIEHLGNRGVFDLNCCYNGYEFWIEIKVYPDKLSKSQIAWLYKRQLVGGLCYVLLVRIISDGLHYTIGNIHGVCLEKLLSSFMKLFKE